MHAKTPSWASLIHLQRCKNITAFTLPTRPSAICKEMRDDWRVMPIKPAYSDLVEAVACRVTHVRLGQHGRVKIGVAR
jgi:hypothetical protein